MKIAAMSAAGQQNPAATPRQGSVPIPDAPNFKASASRSKKATAAKPAKGQPDADRRAVQDAVPAGVRRLRDQVMRS